jgi:hypothetical protein
METFGLLIGGAAERLNLLKGQSRCSLENLTGPADAHYFNVWGVTALANA